ncbi:hypothetical protein ACQPXM_28885 [Kribbella sp. CA-253562]|uniref:hypothetical protein n=1 Tax=Kribbella sp. CA-253562 TaxID=3239942 RepID=UPI003D8B7F0E
MQFLAQVLTQEHVVPIFMCQNEPGLCDEWDPRAGGNTAFVFPRDGLAAAQVPAEGETKLPEASGITSTVIDGVPYEEARQQWATDTGRVRREVLGQLGGEPSWLQCDETPSCRSCAQPMPFVAQLEQGLSRTEINFGGGSGYVFACWPCTEATFLWQS